MELCRLDGGPPRDGTVRTSPGLEGSKDKGALPGARRIFIIIVVAVQDGWCRQMPMDTFKVRV